MNILNLLLISFQDPATPIMEGIVDLHNYIFFYLTIVLFFVMAILFNMIYDSYFRLRNPFSKDFLAHRYNLFSGNAITHGTVIEIVWTLIPSLILMMIAVPSFALLYSMDEVIMPGLVVKAVGHQWYWSYEYSNSVLEYADGASKNLSALSFDSYMIPEDDLKEGQLRLLEVDRQLVLPAQSHIRVLITAADVLHSWAVPSLGIKVDAVPGRLSQANLFIKREGTFYGQCSEICGVNHGFMPIAVKSVSLEDFVTWVSSHA